MKRLYFSLIFSTLALVPFNLFGQWTQLGGPGNGGSVTAFCVVENESGETDIFAATDAGGIFRSSNDGENWIAVNNGLTNYHISTIAAVPDPNGGFILFAGCDAGGVYKSSNNGTYWELLDSLPVGTIYTSIISVPNGSGGFYVIAGASSRGNYRSTDYGATWKRVNNGLINRSVQAIAFSEGVLGVELFTGTSGGVYLSTNAGDDWIDVSSGMQNKNVLSLTTHSNASGKVTVIAGTDKGVYISDNSGETWRESGQEIGALRIISIASHTGRTDNTTIFAGAMNEGIYISTDEGIMWTQPDAPVKSRGVSALMVAYAGTDDPLLFAGSYWKGPYRSKDLGITWDYAGTGISNSVVSYFASSNDSLGNAHLFANAFGRSLFVSHDYGASWNEESSGIFSAYTLFVAVVPVTGGGNSIFVQTSDGIFKSVDGGVSWVDAADGLPGDIILNRLTYSQQNDGTVHLYLLPLSDRLFYSTNDGDSWREISTSVFYPWAEDMITVTGPSNEELLFGADVDGIYRSTDRGTSWSSTGYHGTSVRALLNIDAAGGGNIIFAGLEGSGVQRSTDLGESWTNNSDGLTNEYIYTLERFDNLVFAGTNAGIFVTTDYGDSWLNISGDLQYTAISNLLAGKDKSKADVLYAATYGRAIWSRRISDIVASNVAMSAQPTSLSLGQNYPNPVASGATATIPYTLERRGYVSLKVYNALGRLVATLADGPAEPGAHRAQLVAANLSPGIYFYRLHSDGAVMERKMVVMR